MYDSLCSRNNIAFTPIAYEVGGRPGALWFKEMNRLFDMHPEGKHQSFRQYWFMYISIALQTSIANAILVRKSAFLDKNSRKLNGGFFQDGVDDMLQCTYANVGGTGALFNK